ncbi:helix-turn-helix transcriptional regulator [Halogeometricum limi]|uniref:Predicted transcriptional regulator, contains HTH domain n=1 Tax=Halogeometricum limi TaxID=555875 RepID=A0A1I6I397_9EURY|nr:MarR family transcriptional regulator [Halogeometricum limi]SFR61216.1 Predicted transcriptional regulator, contains HTH domain [Halogeometricum limi]
MDIDEFVGLTRRSSVLGALREGPLDRRDLQERVGVSRPTIHRQVRALEADGLVVKRDGEFALTPVGELAAAEFARVFEVMDTVSALSRVVRWLPAAEFDFDFARLRDAEVVLPHHNDPFAPTRRMLRRIHGADRIRMVTYTFLPEGDPATRRCFIEADQYFEGVLDPTLVETLLADPAATAHFEDLLAQGSTIAVAADSVPLVLIIADETVILGAVDESGCPQGLVVSDDEVIRRWAEETVDSYLADARQVSLDDIGTRAVIADGGT